MNKSHHLPLQAAVTECLLATLSGLNEKHAKKLQKTVVSAAKKLVRKYARLEAKEQKGHQKAGAAAAGPRPKKPALRAAKAAAQPAAGTRRKPAAPGAQKKAAAGTAVAA